MKNDFTLHVLFILSIIMIAIGLLVAIGIASQKTGSTGLWPWLLCLPVGMGGLLYVARESKR